MDRRREAVSGAQAVERAMSVLDCFTEHRELTLTAVSARTGIPVSSTHRIMHALLQGGFLERDDNDRYRIGPRVADLLPRPSVADEVAAPLHALAAGIKIAVAFGVTDGDHVATLVCARPLVAHCRAQMPAPREPLHATAMGKTLLAYSMEGPRVAVDRLRLTACTERSHTSAEALLADLDEIRRRGFALNNEEHITGIRAVAVPVFAADHQMVGAIGVQARPERMTDELISSLVPALRRFSSRLSRPKQDPLPSHR